jgi:hypothetical protein
LEVLFFNFIIIVFTVSSEYRGCIVLRLLNVHLFKIPSSSLIRGATNFIRDSVSAVVLGCIEVTSYNLNARSSLTGLLLYFCMFSFGGSQPAAGSRAECVVTLLHCQKDHDYEPEADCATRRNVEGGGRNYQEMC